EFIYDLISRTRDKGKAEFRQLEVFAQDKWNLSPVNPWDVAYLSEKRRQDLYSLSQEELRPYFPQPKVMQGLFAIVK
ncbi:M3 family metallopeptidase, partial [Legionella pneumophila]